MGDLTSRFSRSEFACKDGCGFDAVDIELVNILTIAAEHFEKTAPSNVKRVAVVLNSGNRCVKYNAALKRSLGLKPLRGKPSQHTKAMAGDVRYQYVFKNGKRKDINPDLVADYFEKKYPNKLGIGRYKGRTHIDTRPTKHRWDKR